MTNFEFYQEKFLQIDKEDNTIRAMKNGQLKFCSEVNCSECEFYNPDGYSCYINFWKWLASEHVDKQKLTKQEKTFLELTDPNYYVARDKDGLICVYTSKPQKDGEAWVNMGNYKYASLSVFSVKFDFIKWEDTEPWKVEDLLELEVEEDVD